MHQLQILAWRVGELVGSMCVCVLWVVEAVSSHVPKYIYLFLFCLSLLLPAVRIVTSVELLSFASGQKPVQSLLLACRCAPITPISSLHPPIRCHHTLCSQPSATSIFSGQGSHCSSSPICHSPTRIRNTCSYSCVAPRNTVAPRHHTIRVCRVPLPSYPVASS